MNQQLREAKQSIRAFVREHFSDQKLAEVIAFNQDRKMEYYNGCSCLMGVTLSDVLHKRCCTLNPSDTTTYHYYQARNLPLANDAERGYNYLGWKHYNHVPDSSLRARRLHAILKGEQYRRSKLVRPIATTAKIDTASLVATT